MRNTSNKIKYYLSQKPHLLINDPAYHLVSLKYAPEMAEVIAEVKRAFSKGIQPVVNNQGATEVFILKDCHEHPLALFKRNCALKEVAAFRLDHRRFAQVPPTILTTLEHPMWGIATGSCQYFIEGVTAVHLGPQSVSSFSSQSVSRMASLDIRLLNQDRHTSKYFSLRCFRAYSY